MEETQTYYEFNSTYNHYSVHFANKQGLSIDRIKDVFSEFGNVLNVGKAGDDFGYRFVKYREENEVKRCIEGLKNHRNIKLLPKRLTQHNNEQNNGQQRIYNWTTNSENLPNPWGQKDMENNGKFNNYQNNENYRSNEIISEKSQLSIETQIPLTNDEKKTSNKTTIDKDEKIIERNEKLRSRTEDPQIGWAKMLLSEMKDNFQPESAILDKILAPIESLPTSDESKIAQTHLAPWNNPIIVNKALKMPVAPSAKSEILSSSDLAIPVVSMDAIPAEIPELVEINLATQKKIPKDEMTKDDRSLKEKIINNEEIYTAEEIYVANIPTDYNVNYICHLFKKHEPIWVDPIKYVQSTAIRFCIVSFRSAEQANACEAQFDGFELGGKMLIIMRPQTLRDIAASRNIGRSLS